MFAIIASIVIQSPASDAFGFGHQRHLRNRCIWISHCGFKQHLIVRGHTLDRCCVKQVSVVVEPANQPILSFTHGKRQIELCHFVVDVQLAEGQACQIQSLHQRVL